MKRLRQLAELEAAVETETPFGGRTRAWAPAGALWIDLRARPGVPRGEAGQKPRLKRLAEAEARDHPAAAVGRRLVVGVQDWRVTDVRRDHPRPGRMILSLEAGD